MKTVAEIFGGGDSLGTLEPGDDVVDANDQAQVDREAEWLEERRGMITGSKLDDLMKPGRAKDAVWSETAKRYLLQKVAERLGSRVFNPSTAPMRWGKENEHPAILQFAKRYGYTDQIGDHQFKNNDGLVLSFSPHQFHQYHDYFGTTPDFIVHKQGEIISCGEVKCHYDPSIHVNTLLTQQVPEKHRWQIRGHLMATSAQWCDFVSFDPRMDEDDPLALVVLPVCRNDDVVELELQSLEARLDKAVEFIDDAIDAIHGRQVKSKIAALFEQLPDVERSEFIKSLSPEDAETVDA